MSKDNKVCDDDLEYHKSTENISFAFFLNLVFMIVVAIGAIFTNSMAILADLLHGMGDTIALGFSWFLQRFSEKECDNKFTYGYKRFSLLGAITTSIIIIACSIFVLIESITRIFVYVEPHAGGMVLIAIFAIILKALSVLKLRKSKTLNEKAVSIHLIGDLLGWIALLVVGIILIFFKIPNLDPFLSIAITIWMIYNLIKNLIYSFNILLLKAPENIDTSKLKSDILAIDEIKNIENFNFWSIDNQNHVLTVKIDIVADLLISDTEKIKNSIDDVCRSYDIENITVEFNKK